MSSLDYLDLCRLCLVKDRASVPIFEGEGDERQIFLKIAACLPVKVAREDKLPKKICDDCVYKVESFYHFWNTTANAEKRLLQCLGEVGVESGKQGYVSNVFNPNVMKQEQSTENRLDGNVMQQVGEHQNNMGMGMMDNMGLGIPMIIPNSNQQQQITSVPMDTSGSSAQNVQAVPGPSSQTTHNQISQNQTSSTQQEDEEESSEDEENSDDECDGDEGLPVKEESEEDPNSRTIEPTTFVNVSLACDEAGPSGLQQQKIAEMPEMPIPQPADGDPKTGSTKPARQRSAKRRTNTSADVSVFQKTKTTKKSSSSIVTRRCRSVKSEINSQSLTTETSEGSLAQDERKNASSTNQSGSQTYYQCETCSKLFRAKNLYEDHLVSHSDARPFQCDLCGKSFKRASTLAVHRKIHTRERNFVCDVCGHAFVQAFQLTTHKRRHFDKYTRYCEICKKGFFSNTELHGHMNAKHDAKEHVCDYCNKSFPSNHTLVKHLMVHDPNFKPVKHQCEFCGKTFVYKNSLVFHVKSHMGENKQECHVCGKSVCSKSSLQDHLRLHSGEKLLICDICGKAFIKRSTLVVHKRTHTGEKPYTCDTCGKSFTQHSSVVIHKRYHTGERPYQCDYCNKKFVSRSCLNAHNKVHTVIVK